MGVGPVGSGTGSVPEAAYAAALDAATRIGSAGTTAAAAGLNADSNAATLGQLAASDLTQLAAMLERQQDPVVAGQVEGLVRDASSAIAQGNTLEAVGTLNQVAALDPQTIEVLRTDPAFAAMRPEIDHLLNHLTPMARMEAEASLGRAEQAMEQGALREGAELPMRAGNLMEAAHRFYDAGGYANYVRASDLAQTIYDNYSPWMINYNDATLVRTGAGVSRDAGSKVALQGNIQNAWEAVRKSAPHKVKRLWVRAPLLVMLLAWLALGLIVGPVAILIRSWAPESFPESFIDFFYEAWGLGFLAMVGLGFYARVRRPRY